MPNGKALDSGWYKLNFDGAAQGNSGPSGAGCIIRDWKSNMTGKLATTLPIGTNNAMEFQAPLLGLKLCNEFNIDRVVVEGDSTLEINALRTDNL